MVRLDHIEKPKRAYELLYPLIRLLHRRVFYRRFDVRGTENLPPAGVPYILVCNHQNGLNDAMAMLFAQNDRSRRPVFIARADIFRNNVAARLLYALRVMPAFRQRDTGLNSLDKNQAVFERAADILRQGGVIGMFPEAVAHQEHSLGNFKKGFSRIAFMAEQQADFRLGLQIVPMGHHYSEYEHTQSRLCLSIGKPFGISDLRSLYEKNPQKAHLALCKRAHDEVSRLMLDIPTEHYRTYDAMRHMASEAVNHDRHLPYYDVLDTERKAVLLPPDQRAADAWWQRVGKLHLDPDLPTTPVGLGQTWLRLAELTLLSLPALIGLTLNLLPVAVTECVTRTVANRVLHSSFRLGLGMLLGMAHACIAAVATVFLATWWLGLAVLAAYAPLVWASLRFRILWKEYVQQIKILWHER